MIITDGYEIVERSQYAGRIAKLYNGIAWLYDFFTGHELAHHKRAVELADIRNNSSILEVACGTGRATAELAAKLGTTGRLSALDLTGAMLDRAKKRIHAKGTDPRVDFRLGDAKSLPFPDGAFDLVYNSYMFDLIDVRDMAEILGEFRRVLKPRGKLALVNMSKNIKGRTLYEALYEKGLLSFVSGSCRPVAMRELAEKAGFKDVRREYRPNHSLFLINLLHGTEIVTGIKE